jgi:hypothetical protein
LAHVVTDLLEPFIWTKIGCPARYVTPGHRPESSVQASHALGLVELSDHSPIFDFALLLDLSSAFEKFEWDHDR